MTDVAAGYPNPANPGLKSGTLGAPAGGIRPIGYNLQDSVYSDILAIGSRNTRSMLRFQQKAPVRPQLNILGDSYCAGNGATSSNGWAQQIATELAAVATVSNYGFAGRPMCMYTTAPRISGTGASTSSQIQILPTSVTLSIMGLNDLRGAGADGGGPGGAGPDPNTLAEVRNKAQAVAAYACIPEANKVRMRNLAESALNPNVTFTGSYTQGYGPNGMTQVIFTATQGATISFTSPVGDLLVVSLPRFVNASATCGWSITIDGISYPFLFTKGLYESYSESLAIIKLPNVAAHSVVLTAVTDSGTQSVMAQWIGCVDSTQDFGGTFIYSTPVDLGDGAATFGWNAPSYDRNSATANSATGSAAYNYGNGALKRMASAIDDAMQELSEFNFNIIKVDCNQGWVYTAMISEAAGVHPNDAGHAHILDKFRFPLRRMFYNA